MDMLGRSKEFFFKICNKIEDRLAGLVAAGITAMAVVVCVVFWEWAKTKHSLETYGWLWVLASTVFFFLIVYSLRSAIQYRGRLKDPRDIVSSVYDWLDAGGSQMNPVETNTPYYIQEVEKYLKSSELLTEKLKLIRLDIISKAADEPRLIEGIKQLISE